MTDKALPFHARELGLAMHKSVCSALTALTLNQCAMISI